MFKQNQIMKYNNKIFLKNFAFFVNKTNVHIFVSLFAKEASMHNVRTYSNSKIINNKKNFRNNNNNNKDTILQNYIAPTNNWKKCVIFHLYVMIVKMEKLCVLCVKITEFTLINKINNKAKDKNLIEAKIILLV